MKNFQNYGKNMQKNNISYQKVIVTSLIETYLSRFVIEKQHV